MDLKRWAGHRNASKPAHFHSCCPQQQFKVTKHSASGKGRADSALWLRGIIWTSAYKREPLLKSKAKRSSKQVEDYHGKNCYHGKICSADGVGEERERSHSVSAPVKEFARSWAIGDHLQPSMRWQIPTLTAGWQISPPSQGELFASFEDGQRDAAGCISTPNFFLRDDWCQNLLCACKLDLIGTSPSPQRKS